ncbi:hypothetical protein AB0J83_32190 [Actinoplanes sp. NPDC049596]|uniref:hypothetical protein n=1 Tax=unclassified Actinoplanes TaxID=2626549 RepID=UPI0034375E1E
MRTTSAGATGTVASGLTQTLAVWAVVVAVVLLVPTAAAAWTALVVGLLGALTLGTWHKRRRRADTAVGAFTGVVLWPVLFGAALIAINIAAYE